MNMHKTIKTHKRLPTCLCCAHTHTQNAINDQRLHTNTLNSVRCIVVFFLFAECAIVIENKTTVMNDSTINKIAINFMSHIGIGCVECFYSLWFVSFCVGQSQVHQRLQNCKSISNTSVLLNLKNFNQVDSLVNDNKNEIVFRALLFINTTKPFDSIQTINNNREKMNAQSQYRMCIFFLCAIEQPNVWVCVWTNASD